MLLLTLSTTTSLADCPPGHDRNDSCSDEGEGSVASATSSAGAESTSEATAGATSNATSSSGGNTQHINISETHPNSIKLRNTASPDTPNPYPTAPCRIGVSGGLSIPGGALSGGGSVEDEECTLRETARSFKDLGVPEMGLYILCTQSDVILGRRDKKGKLEKGEPDPLGSAECLRLVREFTGPVDEPEPSGSSAALSEIYRELELLRESISQHEEAQDEVQAELAAVSERSRARPPSPPRVEERVIQQQYIDEEKRQKLAALIDDEEETK